MADTDILFRSDPIRSGLQQAFLGGQEFSRQIRNRPFQDMLLRAQAQEARRTGQAARVQTGIDQSALVARAAQQLKRIPMANRGQALARIAPILK